MGLMRAITLPNYMTDAHSAMKTCLRYFLEISTYSWWPLRELELRASDLQELKEFVSPGSWWLDFVI